IHAGDPALLSAGAAFPRLVEFEKRYGSVMKGMTRTARQRRAEAAARGEPYRGPGTTWSFQQGLRLLVETLEKKLANPPLYGVNVLRLKERAAPGSAWQVVGEGQDRWSGDALVLTCPAYAQ